MAANLIALRRFSSSRMDVLATLMSPQSILSNAALINMSIGLGTAGAGVMGGSGFSMITLNRCLLVGQSLLRNGLGPNCRSRLDMLIPSILMSSFSIIQNISRNQNATTNKNKTKRLYNVQYRNRDAKVNQITSLDFSSYASSIGK